MEVVTQSQDTPSLQENRTAWPDILRIVAIFGVITLHAASPGFKSFGVRTLQWQTCNLYAALGRIGVPVFVMLSGMFLLDPARTYTIKKLYFSKISRMLTAYLFWSTFYAVVSILVRLHNGTNLNNNLFYFFSQKILSGRIHLWFIFMISGLYIITPFLRIIVKDEKLTIYYLVLSLLFVFAVNFLSLIPQIRRLLALTVNRLDVNLVAGYSGYFVWGYYLSKRQLTNKTRNTIYAIGIISAFSTVVLNGLAAYHFGRPGGWMLKNLSLNILGMATAVFVFFQYCFKDVQFSPKSKSLLALLGKWSFGIYLVHMFFHSNVVPRFFTHPILSIPISSIIIFMFSLITVAVLSKIPVLSKYII